MKIRRKKNKSDSHFSSHLPVCNMPWLWTAVSLIHICFIRQDFSENRIVGEWNGFCATLWQCLPISSGFSKEKNKIISWSLHKTGNGSQASTDFRSRVIWAQNFFLVRFLAQIYIDLYIKMLKHWHFQRIQPREKKNAEFSENV